jgi:branched-chain amino acid transport system permease protein
MLIFTVSEFAQQVVSGLATGAIFGSLALALVLIYRSTNVVNFAQGEMAMFTTVHRLGADAPGISYWPAFVLTLMIAFVGGVATERILIRPVENKPVLTIVIVTIGLLIALNGLAGWIWGADVKAFDSPFPNETWDIGGVAVSTQDVGVFCVCLGDRRSCCGCSSGSRRSASRCAPSRSTRPRRGWSASASAGCWRSAGACAAVLGAVAGMMAAPTAFLDPNMMLVILIYAFARAVLGGIDSPAAQSSAACCSVSSSTCSGATSTSSGPSCGSRQRSRSCSWCS